MPQGSSIGEQTRCASTPFSALIAVGVGGMLLFQTFMNIFMNVGLLPVMGLTLPFFSYGGTSLITMFFAMGVVSGINMRPAPDSNARYIRPPLNAA